ncbi:MAG: TetR/AcrR family transcriptional regulator [Pseudomonadota bacterium]
MARPKSFSSDDLYERALMRFWHRGFEGTSIDDLVKATGISRHGIYTEAGGKKALYLRCFDHYQATVVSPALRAVEVDGAGLTEIAGYFEHQIAVAEKDGLPGPGCFVANASTETAPHDGDVHDKVHQHNARLKLAFAKALKNTNTKALDDAALARIADGLVIFATGLWSMSRLTPSADPLRAAVNETLQMIEARLR